MELMPGYKLSDVGVIPEDWSVEKIGDLIEKQFILGHLDGNHGELYPRSHEFKSYGVPYVGANDFEEGNVTFARCKFLSDERAAKFRKGVARDGDVLFAHNATVGPVALLSTTYPVVILSTTATYFRCNPEKLSNAYLKGALQAQHFVRQYQAVMAQSTRFQVPITAQRKLSLVIAPFPEQRAIATALSDVDALLATLDQVIAKKRDIKRAAMQHLLSGKVRLPGFFGEWDRTTFSDVVRHHAGNSSLIKGRLASTEAAGLFPAYSASGQDVWCKHYEYEGDAVVVSAVGSRCGNAFATSGKWCAIANTHVVWPDGSKVDKKFLGYYIDDEDFWMKSGTGQPFVLFKQSFARPLSLPPLPEQAAIASVLSDMDAELLALECHLEKNRNIKQAMMQELLTGRTRLV